jgi:hypothetical protein
MARKAMLGNRARGMRHEASEDAVESAMREVHTNVPKNVKATGKKGKAKEKMLQAIAFSKARRGK